MSKLDATERGTAVTVEQFAGELAGVSVCGWAIYASPRRANAKPIAIRADILEAYALVESRGFVRVAKFADDVAVSPVAKMDRLNDEALASMNS